MSDPIGNITIDDLKDDLNEKEGKAERVSEFPLGTLPPKLEELIKGSEISYGMPSEFHSASCLFAASGAIGNSFQLEIKKGVYQKAVFYLALVGNPNTNKSNTLSFALKPLIKKDGEYYKEYVHALAEYKSDQALPKKEREGIKPPINKKHIIGDITPEALVSIHEQNQRGVLVHRDELIGWIKSFNRYSSGGGEQEFWLSNWSLSPIVVDRQIRGTQRVEKPFIGVVGTTQPLMVEELGKGSRVLNGFIDRLLFVWPKGLKKPKWTEKEINLPLVEAYQNAIERLIDIPFEAYTENQTLTLKPDAKKCLFDYYNNELKLLCDKSTNEFLAGMYGKFDFHTARIIIVLHLLWWAYSEKEFIPKSVDKHTVQRAIEISKYFQKQSLKVYNNLHVESPADKLPNDKSKIYEALPREFKFGEGHKIAINLFPETSWKHDKTFRRFLNGTPKLFNDLGHGRWGKIY